MGVSLAVLVAAVPFAVRALARAPATPHPGWTTVFSDSFSGAAGSGAGPAWTYDTGTRYRGTGCTGDWGNGEIDTDTSATANVSQDGRGHLNVTPVDLNGTWTSGRIETVADDFAAPVGGEMEVSAYIKQPAPAAGLGYWSAFWMLGAGYRASGAGYGASGAGHRASEPGPSGTMDCSSWPSTGEIDVMEDVNAQSQVSGTLHCGTDLGGPCHETSGLGRGQPCPGCQSRYNTYSVIINRTNPRDESITWLVDGRAYNTVTERQVGAAAWRAAVDHGFFLILDVAIGGSYPDSVCGCTTPSVQTTSGAAMSVGYVAVYTRGDPGREAA